MLADDVLLGHGCAFQKEVAAAPNSAPASRESGCTADAAQALTDVARLEARCGSGNPVDWAHGSLRFNTVTDLHELRSRIDELDQQLVRVLAERLAICEEVARVKEGSDTPVIQP